MKIDKETIRRRALELVAEAGHGIAPKLASEFGISRQVANGYMQALLKEGQIEAEGSTRARTYMLKTLAEASHAYPREGLQEDIVWRRDFMPLVADLPQNPRDVWHYGVTEIVNNAVDHSGAREVRVSLRRDALATTLTVADDGEGIFLKIQRVLGLADPREAILELAKGKLTTAPEQHSGEGIFFTSRVMDEFDIRSGHLHFQHRGGRRDVIEERNKPVTGTEVRMRLSNHSERTLKSVFDQFADDEEYSFDRTVVPVHLAQHEGEKLVSRSQAKRIAHRFERFKEVVLDFEGVAEIGQAFADELFRVFAASHPGVRLAPIHTSEAVGQMDPAGGGGEGSAMSVVKRLVCLANSRKLSGRCIAGKELTDAGVGSWIRPVSDRENEEVSEHERQYKDGSDPRLLDIIDVTLVQPVPHDCQQENWLLDPNHYWVKKGAMTWDELTPVLDPVMPLWNIGDSTYNGLNDRIALPLPPGVRSSLRLIQVPNLTLSVFSPGRDFGNNKRRVQGRFAFSGTEYWLWVTDPGYERNYLGRQDGDYRLGECVLTISISEPYNDACYKLIAAIIERNPGN